MAVYRLGRTLAFPPPEGAEPNGLLAVGGDLSVERLLLAYSMGIFPWYDDTTEILWFSPNPRGVLTPAGVVVHRSLARRLRSGAYTVTMDEAFGRVIRACATQVRRGQRGTWITADMIDAYEELHRLGFAHSVETWRGSDLVGGLYGVSLGRGFFGESMFSNAVDASKVAFVHLAAQLRCRGFAFIDCQVRNDHMESLGTREWPRERFLEALAAALQQPTLRGRWSLDADLDVLGELARARAAAVGDGGPPSS